MIACLLNVSFYTKQCMWTFIISDCFFHTLFAICRCAENHFTILIVMAAIMKFTSITFAGEQKSAHTVHFVFYLVSIKNHLNQLLWFPVQCAIKYNRSDENEQNSINFSYVSEGLANAKSNVINDRVLSLMFDFFQSNWRRKRERRTLK